MTQYPTDVRDLMAREDARADELDSAITRHAPEWLAWEVPSLLLELERGGASVCAANQARIRGLYALHLTGECFASPPAFEALAWLLSGVEAPGLEPHPVDLLHAVDAVRAVAAAHKEEVPSYAPEVTSRIADVCRRNGYIALPAAYPDVQAAIRAELTDEGAAIEKKAQQLAQHAFFPGKTASDAVFEVTPEGVAAARCAALEIGARR